MKSATNDQAGCLHRRKYLDADLELIEKHARVDALPEVDGLKGLRRRAARMTASLVLYLTRFFARPQTQVNLSSLNAFRHALDLFSDADAALRNMERKVQGVKSDMLSLEYRLNAVLDNKPQSGAAAAAHAPSELPHSLDALYLAFENEFRGRREDVKKKLMAYTPYVQAAAREASGPALDIGCGRGEWLELMRAQGLAARGIDSNRLQLEECRKLKLDVEEADWFEYLAKVPASSLSLVTGFHVIEHISFYPLVRLLDEIHRVLAPGGMVIFETPNPENTDVGSCLFYTDPTHQKPLFPPTIRFLAEQRGYINIEILRLNPESASVPSDLPAEHELASRLNPVFELLRSRFAGGRDFSMIARKPR